MGSAIFTRETWNKGLKVNGSSIRGSPMIERVEQQAGEAGRMPGSAGITPGSGAGIIGNRSVGEVRRSEEGGSR